MMAKTTRPHRKSIIHIYVYIYGKEREFVDELVAFIDMTIGIMKIPGDGIFL
jgi:hypothetical protein